MAIDTLHSHVGGLRYLVKRDIFSFPMVKNLQRSALKELTSLYISSTLLPAASQWTHLALSVTLKGRHLVCDCFNNNKRRSRDHVNTMRNVCCSEYHKKNKTKQNKRNKKKFEMKRKMRPLHHHLVTFSQSVSCLVAYFCRTVI